MELLMFKSVFIGGVIVLCLGFLSKICYWSQSHRDLSWWRKNATIQKIYNVSFWVYMIVFFIVIFKTVHKNLYLIFNY